jgi:hypothetical protein
LQGVEASFGEAGAVEGASARGKMGGTGNLDKVLMITPKPLKSLNI